MLRIDDIPQQVADDIHAFGVIGFGEREMIAEKSCGAIVFTKM